MKILKKPLANFEEIYWKLGGGNENMARNLKTKNKNYSLVTNEEKIWKIIIKKIEEID